ncbi:FMN-linked oxidoreductase [Coniophora puteana RWD-64-598 SS2]|uniref:FMN-linked oxidoreductase n=1 Tax=Coniophora puteana (strain RWD-64-598) TaxID=741705 RepID=A0A5M3MH69_CONPW|nr:FMN-linked oxidoreductase [Coniophora puteana RWD-64-598 SS2]EIW78290.1 FMN-linked oxidoreductase [Coniophora puteana RWD-64-598 SS2]
MEVVINKPAWNTSYFTPAQEPPSGTAIGPQPNDAPVPKLFQPIKIRGVTFHNRIFVAPMCQYSADDGHLTAWHFAHLGGIFTRGPALTIIEATAVLPEGRITPEDSGLWKDSQIEPLRKIVEFAHAQGQKIAIQLAHAGRKASTNAPWLRGKPGVAADYAVEMVGGWPERVFGPSDTQFDRHSPVPKAMTRAQIQEVKSAFVASAKRALRAGVDAIEIHNAHGYLLFSFLSPYSNKRTDEYGGSFENRTRLTLEVVDALRSVIPEDMPLLLRISATEWLEETLPDAPQWRSEDTVRLAGLLAEHGVDFLDVSSGGNNSEGRAKAGEGYQAPFAEAVKKAHGDKLVVGAVGMITSGTSAQSILDKGMADVILAGRTFQKNPAAVWTWAEELGVNIKIANQIEWGFIGRGGVPRS